MGINFNPNFFFDITDHCKFKEEAILNMKHKSHKDLLICLN